MSSQARPAHLVRLASRHLQTCCQTVTAVVQGGICGRGHGMLETVGYGSGRFMCLNDTHFTQIPLSWISQCRLERADITDDTSAQQISLDQLTFVSPNAVDPILDLSTTFGSLLPPASHGHLCICDRLTNSFSLCCGQCGGSTTRTTLG